MLSYVISIKLPPSGELEISGDGSSPTDDQMAEEKQSRYEFIDYVSPKFRSTLGRPPKRMGNVTRIELLGTNTWSQLNNYLLIVSVDIGDPMIDLDALLPHGANATVIGSYSELQVWQAWPETTNDDGD